MPDPNLFLIAHKVRGEPAFDVAGQMPCPECNDPNSSTQGCVECDHFGFWWIIPTSGHRAYPIMLWPLDELCQPVNEHDWQPDVITVSGPLIEHPDFARLPDHYPTRSEPAAPRLDITSLFPKGPRPPTIRRRL